MRRKLKDLFRALGLMSFPRSPTGGKLGLTWGGDLQSIFASPSGTLPKGTVIVVNERIFKRGLERAFCEFICAHFWMPPFICLPLSPWGDERWDRIAILVARGGPRLLTGAGARLIAIL